MELPFTTEMSVTLDEESIANSLAALLQTKCLVRKSKARPAANLILIEDEAYW
jgi:hypothetical protein